MICRSKFSRILLACISLTLLNAAYAEQQVDPGKISGRVMEIIDVSGYTYVEVDTGENKVWAAGPTTALKTGDTVAFTTQMPMQNFHSKSIGRDFPVIYFINSFITDKETSAAASSHPQIKQQQVVEIIKGINKAEGGNTISEIYTDKSDLNGKTIRVRGQVTKFSRNIMGKNWIHIRDSSTLDDLTVTSNDMSMVGDVVIAEGRLELDRDYGYGYLYPVILEEATITKE